MEVSKHSFGTVQIHHNFSLEGTAIGQPKSSKNYEVTVSDSETVCEGEIESKRERERVRERERECICMHA